MTERWIAYGLIAIGIIALATNLTPDTGWVWAALVSAIFLVAYTRNRQYAFLVVGCILAGVALGLLFTTLFAVLLSLGLAFLAIDRIEPRVSRWPIHLSLIFIVLAVVTWLLDSGILGSVWFALLLIAAGAFLLYRASDRDWVEVAAPDAGARQPGTGAPASSAAAGGPPAAATPPLREQVSPAAGHGGAASEPAGDAALARSERLSAWVRETAKAEGLAPYLVLQEATVHEIARRNPDNLDALAEIKGIGPTKLHKYGEAILSVLKQK